MTKRPAEIDNHFCPGHQPEGCLFLLIFGTATLALAAALIAFGASL